MADIDELKKKLEDGWIKGEPYVFVSYASKDKEKVYEFVYELRKRGINVYKYHMGCISCGNGVIHGRWI